jgi:IS1 family transposase
MNRLSIEDRARILSALVEGNSIRSVCRMLGVAKRTVTRLLVEVGTACYEYQDRAMRDLPCRLVQCDEIWSYVGCKEKQVTPAKAEKGPCGDAWVWVAIDAESKLVPCWLVGKRDPGCATEFIQDLASRLRHRVQLTTDGLRMYLSAVEDSFGSQIDYAMLVKVYGNDPTEQKRYSPAICTGCKRENKIGGAEVDLIFQSARLVFSRWQIQCKNTSRVSLDDVAKEVGLTHFLKSNVIVMVSTGEIGPEARRYANKIMSDSNLCIVMVDRGDLALIDARASAIVDVFMREARHAMDLKKLEI